MQTKFNLSDEFNLYGKFDGNEMDIDDIDDIKNAFNLAKNKDQKKKSNKHFKVIHLYISEETDTDYDTEYNNTVKVLSLIIII